MSAASGQLEIDQGGDEEIMGNDATVLVLGAVEGRVGVIPSEDRFLASDLNPSSKSHTSLDGSFDEQREGGDSGDLTLGGSKRPRLTTDEANNCTTTTIAKTDDVVNVPGSDLTTRTTNRVVTLEDLYREGGIFKRAFSTIRTLAEAHTTATNPDDPTSLDPRTESLATSHPVEAPEDLLSRTVTPGPAARPTTPHDHRSEASKLLRDKTTQVHQLERVRRPSVHGLLFPFWHQTTNRSYLLPISLTTFALPCLFYLLFHSN